MAARYESGYWENHPSYHARLADIGRQRGGVICDWIGHLVGRDDLVLDVGCGPGVILNHIRETLGCRVLGVEPSVDQAASAQKRYGLEVIPDNIHTAELDDRKPKVIVLSHVVEHMYDPVSALRRCEQLLASGGHMFVEVPNILRPAVGKRLGAWLSREHVYYYSLASLAHILSRTGFSAVRSDGDGPVRVLASRPATYQLPLREYWAVRLAVVRHQAIYWPWKIAQKLALAS